LTTAIVPEQAVQNSQAVQTRFYRPDSRNFFRTAELPSLCGFFRRAASSMTVDEGTFCQNPCKILSRVDIERVLLCQKLQFLRTIKLSISVHARSLYLILDG
jgi:hypothetical protein